MFMPAKYQPDYMFLRNVPMRRVHLFTSIQLLCILVLCVIKELDIVSIVFPVMVSTADARCRVVFLCENSPFTSYRAATYELRKSCRIDCMGGVKKP